MNQPRQDFNVIDTVEVNGRYLEEQRMKSDRRKNLQKHYALYERRSYQHRRQPFHISIDIEV